MYGTLISTTTLSQSKPGSKWDKGVTSYSPELQNWNLTTRCISWRVDKAYAEDAIAIFYASLAVRSVGMICKISQWDTQLS